MNLPTYLDPDCGWDYVQGAGRDRGPDLGVRVPRHPPTRRQWQSGWQQLPVVLEVKTLLPW